MVSKIYPIMAGTGTEKERRMTEASFEGQAQIEVGVAAAEFPAAPGSTTTVPVAATLWMVNPLCCAWPFIILLTSVGLGAVIHTRFGTQSCGRSGTAAEPEVLPIEAMDEEAGQPDNATGGTP
jgi:hypothetical protein